MSFLNQKNQNELCDPNFEILKKEFNKLYESTIKIKESLSIYYSNIKDIYLSPNSIYNIIKNSYNNNEQHPLLNYSNLILEKIENEIKQWEINSSFNSTSVDNQNIQNYCLSLNECKVKIDKLDQFKSISQINQNDQKKQEYIQLKEQVFNESKLLFDNRIECFDIPLINIEYSFNSLIQLIQMVLNSSSSLLQSQIYQNNSISNLFPNNDFLNQSSSPSFLNGASNNSNFTQSPTLVKRPASVILNKPPLQQQSLGSVPPSASSNTAPPAPSQSLLKPSTFKPSPFKMAANNNSSTTNSQQLQPVQPIIPKRPASVTLNKPPPSIQQQQQQQQPLRPAPPPTTNNTTSSYQSQQYLYQPQQIQSQPVQPIIPKRPASVTLNKPPPPIQQQQPPIRPVTPMTPQQSQLQKQQYQSQPQQTQQINEKKSNSFESSIKKSLGLTFKNLNLNLNLKPTPPLDQLIDDHEYHRKLWDNKRWKLVKTYNKSVNITTDFLLTFKPNSQVTKFRVYAAIPQTLQNQVIRSTSSYGYDANTNQIIKEPRVIESSHQKLWYYEIENPQIKDYIFKYDYHLDVYKVEMVEVTDPNEIVQVEPISEKDLEIYLRPTDILNFNKPEFEKFILDNGFYPKQLPDGTMESVLCFAYRIYLFMIKKFTYKYPHTLTGQPIEFFNEGYGDCGSHSYFFTSIMRYNNIPCRLLFGRHTLDSQNLSYAQTHVKTDIYVENIGWVGMDVTVKDLNGDHTYRFTKESGDFLTTGLDFSSNVEGTSEDRFLHLQWSSYFYWGKNIETKVDHISRMKLISSPSKQEQLKHINQTLNLNNNYQPPQQQQPLRSTPPLVQKQPIVNMNSINNQRPPIYSNNNNINSYNNNNNNSEMFKLYQSSKNPAYRHLDMPRSPPYEQLINNRSIHKNLWDNKRWKLVKTFSQSVTITMVGNLKFRPDSKLKSVTAIISLPPNINNQVVLNSSVTLFDGNTNQYIKDAIIESTQHGDIYNLTLESNQPLYFTNFNFQETLLVDLYKVEMVQVTNPNEYIEVEPITQEEIDRYLRPIPIMNMNTNEFNQFIESNRLYPLQDESTGELESVLCFSYRVNLFLLKFLEYALPYGHDGHINNIIRSKKGDCFCHSNLFCSIMRLNNILCRILFGRVVEIGTPKEGRTHCKIEIYEQSIGWIPIDPTCKNLVEYGTTYFGIDNGDFITFGLDYYDIPDRSTNDPQSFQSFYFSYSSFGHNQIQIESRSNNVTNLKLLNN